MEQRPIFIDAINGDTEFVVGALLMRNAAELDQLLTSLHEAAEKTEAGDGLRLAYVKAFLDTSARFSALSVPVEHIPTVGRCREVYHNCQRVVAPWLEAGEDCRIWVAEDFEQRSCGGKGCKFVYVAGSPCPASFGRPVAQNDAHLRICDLASTIERKRVPRCQVEVAAASEEAMQIIELIDLLSELALAGDRHHAEDTGGERSKSTDLVLQTFLSADCGKIELSKMGSPQRRGKERIRSLRTKEAKLEDPDSPSDQTRF